MIKFRTSLAWQFVYDDLSITFYYQKHQYSVLPHSKYHDRLLYNCVIKSLTFSLMTLNGNVVLFFFSKNEIQLICERHVRLCMCFCVHVNWMSN